MVHGGLDRELRKKSCEFLSSLDFEGHAIGGSLGKNREEMLELVKDVMPWLPEDKPNHLLGIGDLESIRGIIEQGVDTFDSSHPTKCARHGLLFAKNGTMRIVKKGNAELFEPIEKDCNCSTCKNYTVAYLHHLFKASEPIFATLATIHNVAFMVKLMKEYRNEILKDEV